MFIRRYWRLILVEIMMTHIFVINSHTTFLTSLGVINLLKLKDENVIFCYLRNYINSFLKIPYRTYDISTLFDSLQDDFEQGRDRYDIIERCDSFVKALNVRGYNLYVPHLACTMFQLLYTHKLCKKISFIQEGAVQVRNDIIMDRPIIDKIRTTLGLMFKHRRYLPGGWYVAGTIYKQRYLEAYATNERIFKYLPCRNRIIEWPKIQHFDLDLPEGVVFVFDGFVGNEQAEYNVYMKNCERLINQYNDKRCNLIKFHPAQSEQERNCIINYLINGHIPYKVLSDSIPLELSIISGRKNTYVGFGSSLLYYAKDNGHNVICHDDWMMETSEKYRKHKERCGIPLFSQSYKG